MATIGLDKLYYAKITEGENGEETTVKPQFTDMGKRPTKHPFSLQKQCRQTCRWSLPRQRFMRTMAHRKW